MPANLKRMVRARMAETGENYTTALRHVRSQEQAPPPPPAMRPPPEPAPASEDAIPFYVLTKSPADYPGKFVLRRHLATPEGLKPDKDSTVVTASLSEARAGVPGGWTRLDPDPDDDPMILEWYADVRPVPTGPPPGCGVMLDLGNHIVTKCGLRPSILGGMTVALCPPCMSKLKQPNEPTKN